MTQKQKELLLKDLCGRLPYGVKVNDDIQGDFTLIGLTNERIFTTCEVEVHYNDFPIENIKPYLLPLSSMTEEQKKEINKRYVNFIDDYSITIRHHSDGYWDDDTEAGFSDYLWIIDWFNKNHFDYRGLIPMGLAIDATNKNIY